MTRKTTSSKEFVVPLLWSRKKEYYGDDDYAGRERA